jgi:hypothetical protein
MSFPPFLPTIIYLSMAFHCILLLSTLVNQKLITCESIFQNLEKKGCRGIQQAQARAFIQRLQLLVVFSSDLEVTVKLIYHCTAKALVIILMQLYLYCTSHSVFMLYSLSRSLHQQA